MSTSGAIGFRGLKTSPNPLNQPAGSLAVADNCCILYKDKLEPRRGQPPLSKSADQLDPAYFGFGDKAHGTVTFASCAEGDTITANGVTFTAVTTLAAPDDFLMTGTNSQTAAAFATAVVASATGSVITPTASSSVATLTAVTPGAAGNSYTLVSSNGTRLACSSSTLTGGTLTSGAGITAGALGEWRSQERLVVQFTSDPAYAGGTTGGVALYASDFQSNASTFDTILPPDPTHQKMKFAELSKNLYYTGTQGPRFLASTSASGAASGVARPYDSAGPGLSGIPTIGLTGEPNAAGSWLTTNNAVAYRACIVKKDANNNVKVSAPNGRFVVVNPADASLAISKIAVVDATSSTLATATLDAGHGFRVGDKATLLPGESNFPAHTSLAALTVTAVTTSTVSWAVTATSSITNSVLQTLSSGTKSVSASILFTSFGVTSAISVIAGDFVRLYRTEDSGGAAINPGDEELLCYERRISTSEATAGALTIADFTPEAFLGEPLYTNLNTGQGADQANNKPPVCNDLCVFDGRLWGAQTTDRQAMNIRLIGTGSPNGLQTGDFLAVGNFVLPATVNSGGYPTQNIFDTAANYVALYAAFSSVFDSSRQARTVLDSISSPVGLMVFEDINTGGSTFYAATTRQSAFQDPLPVLTAVTAAATSRLADVVYITTTAAHGLSTGDSLVLAYQVSPNDNTHFPCGVKTGITVTGASTLNYAETGSALVMNGSALAYVYATTYASDAYAKQLRFSKQGQPEAWPQINWLGGLPDGAEVLRIAPLQNSLYVFLKHGAIYTVSGSYPYNVQRFDNTASLIAADSLVEHSGRLFGLTTQGVCAISSAGVQVMSLDIEEDLRNLIADLTADGDALQIATFAVSYESDRQYQLWMASASTNLAATQCLVFQSDKNEWTRWYGEQREITPSEDDFITTARYCGLVFSPFNCAFYGDAVRKLDSQSNTNILLQENKTYSRADFSDYTVQVNGTLSIEADNNLYFTPGSGLSSEISNIKGGDIFLIGATQTLVNGISADFPDKLQLSAGYIPAGTEPFTVWRTIPTAFEWVMDAGGAAGIEKHWREIQLHFKFLLSNWGVTGITGTATAPAANGLLVATFSNEQSGSTATTVAVVPPITSMAAETGPFLTLRLEVPEDMQRAAMLRVNVSINSSLAEWQLLGWSQTNEGISEKTGQ